MNDNEVSTTVSVGSTVTSADHDQARDVVSDPAKDNTDGLDWSDEGGATPSGPATNNDRPAD